MSNDQAPPVTGSPADRLRATDMEVGLRRIPYQQLQLYGFRLGVGWVDRPRRRCVRPLRYARPDTRSSGLSFSVGACALFSFRIEMMGLGASFARTLFITVATFLAMRLPGYTTRTDLARFGSFLLMALLASATDPYRMPGQSDRNELRRRGELQAI